MPVPSGVARQARPEIGRTIESASARRRSSGVRRRRQRAIATAVAVISRTPPSATAPCTFAHTTNSSGIGQWRSRTRKVSSSGTASKLTSCGRSAQALGSNGSQTTAIRTHFVHARPTVRRYASTIVVITSAAPNNVSAGIPPSRKNAYDTGCHSHS